VGIFPEVGVCGLEIECVQFGGQLGQVKGAPAAR
jgi:hypothetical protein